MIVHPDFRGHWKTKRLVRMTGDKAAPLMLLSLWGYCQIQKKFEFDDLPPAVLAEVCESEIPGDQLLTILLECQFVRMDGKRLIVHDWEKVNRMFVSAWANGKKGGNPADFTRSATRSDRERLPGRLPTTRARDSGNEKKRAGYPTGSPSDSDAPRVPAQSGAVGGGIKAGKLLLAANSETDDADNRRRAALKKFGGLANAVAEKLNPDDKS